MDQKPNPSSLSSISPAPAPAPALARAAAIQASLKQIVLHTAYALKARTHYVRLGVTAAVPDGQPGAHGAAGLASLGGECEKYLGLVRGLESYLVSGPRRIHVREMCCFADYGPSNSSQYSYMHKRHSNSS